jgi:hypothetical protein
MRIHLLSMAKRGPRGETRDDRGSLGGRQADGDTAADLRHESPMGVGSAVRLKTDVNPDGKPDPETWVKTGAVSADARGWHRGRQRGPALTSAGGQRNSLVDMLGSKTG